MPRRDAKDRQFMMYYPSEKDRERHRKLAKKHGMPFCQWIYEMVEAHIATLDEEPSQSPQTQEELRALRREKDKSDALIASLETEIYKLRKEAILAREHGPTRIDDRLIAILRNGRTWLGREILKELGVNPDDSKAIQIITEELHELQDLGLVTESQRGWKWKK